MLKRKLFLALAAVSFLIVVAGGFGVWLLFDHVASFQRVVERNFEGIKLVNDFRLRTAALESGYLPALVGDDETVDLGDESVFRERREGFERDLQRLDELARTESFGESEDLAVTRLEEAVETYLERFEALFESEVQTAPQSERIELRREVLKASYEVAARVDQLLVLLEGAVTAEHERAIRQARNSARFLAILTAAAVLIAGFVYLILSRRLIRPLSELGDSIREVEQQNFERVLPVNAKDEVGAVATAFNNMAAELRVMKMETDQEMLRLNQESRAILMGFPNPIFILDGNGDLSQSNPAAEELMASLGDEGGIPSKLSTQFQECLESGEAYLPDEIEAAMLFRADEREFWYLPRIFRVRESLEDEFQGWAVVLIDVTRVRWLDDMKTDLIGTVSHEIKTPLTSIRMVLHLLAEKKTGPLNQTQDSIVTSARDDCERLLETLDNLLQLTRIESGESSLQREPVQPGELIEEAADSFAGHVEEAQLSVRTEIAEDLPRVLADRHRIGQVFNNLLSNAVKYSPAGGEIVLSAERDGEQFVRFSVIDRGPGIPEEAQDRIFERFYRAPGQNGDGTGLGLSICREIVRAHAGRIGFSSAPEQPTEFYFYLPLSSQ